jgi:hypothetical protein
MSGPVARRSLARGAEAGSGRDERNPALNETPVRMCFFTAHCMTFMPSKGFFLISLKSFFPRLTVFFFILERFLLLTFYDYAYVKLLVHGHNFFTYNFFSNRKFILKNNVLKVQ